MKGYLYTLLASSSNPDVSIFFRCRNEGISLYYIDISSNPEVSIFFRCRNERGIPSFLHLKKILTSGLLEDANIV
jgi:hypothetical protein